MLFVPEQCSCISRITQVITVITFHVYRVPSQIALCNESPQPSGSVGELTVVSCGQLEPFFPGQVDELLGLVHIEGEGLVDIHVTAVLEAESGNIEMTLRWCRDVDNIRSSLGHKFSHIIKVLFDRESFVELPGHERLPVADPHDLTTTNPQNLRGVGVSDF